MGRYKLGPQGAYYDPNDSGPDQASPEQIQALQQPPAPFDPSRGSEPGGIRGNFPSGDYQPPTGGINPGPNPSPMPQPLPNIPGTPGWNGGFTGGWYQDPSRGKVIDPFMNLGPGGQAGIYPWVQGQPPPGYQPPGGFSGPFKPPTGGINPWGTGGLTLSTIGGFGK